jgi:hypothetical protein
MFVINIGFYVTVFRASALYLCSEQLGVAATCVDLYSGSKNVYHISFLT